MEELTYRGQDGCPLFAYTVASPIRSNQPALVFLHGGGPDHHSMKPLAEQFSGDYKVLLPDSRGYGRSVCDDPQRHTWDQYTDDLKRLLDHCGLKQVILVGAGIGATISLRAALAYPGCIQGLVLISVEDIEDDQAKEAEMAFLDNFAERVRAQGIQAGWEPILPNFPPLIGAMVREAIPRSTPASIAAAAAIGRDRAFTSPQALAAITIPALLFPGTDSRHPTALARQLAQLIPQGEVSDRLLSDELQTAEDFARFFAPPIRHFLTRLEMTPSNPSYSPL